MDHSVLNSSDLYTLLQDTLLITEKVKEILKRNCDEATFVLKPWQVKTIIERQANETICTCTKVCASQNETEEITVGISRTIILAQELREKLKFNVGTKKKPLRKDTIENIYLSNSASINDFKKLSRTNIATQKADTAKNANHKKANTSQNDNAATMRSLPHNLISSSKQRASYVTDKKQSNALLKGVTTKSKGKNFILENKLNIRKISSANKLQADDADPQNPRDVYNTMMVQDKDENNN